MEAEIEVKFLEADFEELRKKLKNLGAELELPMRLMRRVLLDYPDGRFRKNGYTKRLRVRDEGGKVFINFKSKNETNYVDEIEVEVESFEKMIELLEAVGLKKYSSQESKRETWRYKNVEVVLDEWPWLDPYIEIEGPSEEDIKDAAKDLGFDWKDAKYGSVDTAYQHQYHRMTNDDSISDIAEVRFNKPVPEYFLKRK